MNYEFWIGGRASDYASNGVRAAKRIMNFELGSVRAIVGAMGAERTSDCKSNGSKGSYGGYAAVVLLKTFWTAS